MPGADNPWHPAIASEKKFTQSLFIEKSQESLHRGAAITLQ
jgi:hypothetical protein